MGKKNGRKTKALAIPKDNRRFFGLIPQTTREILNRRVPAEFIYTRPGRGGLDLQYVSIGYVANVLNEAFGEFWSFETDPVSVEMVKTGHIVVKGKLSVTIPTTGLTIVKEQFGSAEVKFYKPPNPNVGKPVDIGDDFKAAASDALKKCASLFGVAKELYFMDIERAGNVPQSPASKKGSPVETTGDNASQGRGRKGKRRGSIQRASPPASPPVILEEGKGTEESARKLYDRMKAMRISKQDMAKILVDEAGVVSFYKLTDDNITNLNVYLDALQEQKEQDGK